MFEVVCYLVTDQVSVHREQNRRQKGLADSVVPTQKMLGLPQQNHARCPTDSNDDLLPGLILLKEEHSNRQ